MTLPIGAAVGAPDALGDLGSGVAPGTEQAPDATAPQQPTEEPQGELLDEPDKARVCKRLEDMWKSRDQQLKPLIAQWDANELSAQGVPGVRAVYDPERGWFARIPNSASERVGPSKTWELIGKTTATILADEPVPDAEPAHDADPERSAAELATLILKNEMGESGLHLIKRAELASNLAGTHGSAFDVFTVDPKGGGWAPLEVQAHPAATHYDDANPDAVTVDPATGQPTENYVKRYVMPDGALAVTPVGARRTWRMAIRVQRKTGRQVRLYPQTCEGIEDATSVIIADAISFGELCSLYPEIRTWSPEQQVKLVSWRPVKLTAIVPREMGIVGDGKEIDKDGPNAGRPNDSAIVVTLTFIAKSHASYPGGAYIVAAGGEFVLVSQQQIVVVGEGDYACEECLMLPVAQCEAYSAPKGGNQYGIGDAEFLGPDDEIRQQVMSGILDRIYQLNNRNCFVDVSSDLDANVLALRDGTPLPADLRAGTPVWEDVPSLEPELFEVYSMIGGEMNSRVGLEAAAQGVSSPEVKSGRHAQQVVEQALVALTQRKRNLDAFITRSWRIVLQLYRAYATTPQLLKYPSDDESYAVREWKNTDLGSARDVRFARGTGTMLTKTAKMNIAQQDLETAIATADPQVISLAYRRYERVTSGNVNPLLGIEEDPHRLRVRRQVSEYMKGPPPAPAQPMAPEVPALPELGEPEPGPELGEQPANELAEQVPNANARMAA